MASSTSYSYSSTTNTADSGATTGHRYSTSSTTDKDGTTVVRTARQDMGRPVVIEERRYDHTGQEELLPPVTEVAGDMGFSSTPSTPAESENDDGEVRRMSDLDGETKAYGNDSGMALYALSGQGGPAWRPGNGGEAKYAALLEETRFIGLMLIRTKTSETGTTRREYEDPSTGARMRKESEIDMSTVL